MYFKHLTFEDRVKLQFLLETNQNPRLKDISEQIRVTASTISRELKRSTVATPGRRSQYIMVDKYKQNVPAPASFLIAATAVRAFPLVLEICIYMMPTGRVKARRED